MLIDKLEEITPNLPEVPLLTDFKKIENLVTSYEFKDGVAISQNLYNTPDIAIAKTFIPKGTTFEEHIHYVSGEWVIILEGALKMFFDGKEQLLNKHDCVMVIANKPHCAIAVEDTTIIAITIPRDDGWPD